MVEPLLPHLTGEVRQMTDCMVADQRRELEELERKARARPGGEDGRPAIRPAGR